jgi:hypothetical protein
MNILPFNEKLDHDEVPKPYNQSDSVTEFELKEKILHAAGVMYKDLDLSAREVLKVFDAMEEFHPNINKVFYNLYGPKGKGHGGARRNRKFKL